MEDFALPEVRGAPRRGLRLILGSGDDMAVHNGIMAEEATCRVKSAFSLAKRGGLCSAVGLPPKCA